MHLSIELDIEDVVEIEKILSRINQQCHEIRTIISSKKPIEEEEKEPWSIVTNEIPAQGVSCYEQDEIKKAVEARKLEEVVQIKE